MKRVAEYFEQNPQVGSVWVTSDGFIFDLQRHASGHAAGLIDQGLQKFTNSSTPNVEDDKTKPDATDSNKLPAATSSAVKAPVKAKSAKATPAPKTTAPKKASTGKAKPKAVVADSAKVETSEKDTKSDPPANADDKEKSSEEQAK